MLRHLMRAGTTVDGMLSRVPSDPKAARKVSSKPTRKATVHPRAVVSQCLPRKVSGKPTRRQRVPSTCDGQTTKPQKRAALQENATTTLHTARRSTRKFDSPQKGSHIGAVSGELTRRAAGTTVCGEPIPDKDGFLQTDPKGNGDASGGEPLPATEEGGSSGNGPPNRGPCARKVPRRPTRKAKVNPREVVCQCLPRTVL